MVIIGAVVLLGLIVGVFFYKLGPVNTDNKATMVFEVKQGDGFRDIAASLYHEKLIKSSSAFDLFALLGGRALALKPGLYRLSPAMSTQQILDTFSGGGAGETTVTIPEGSNIYTIDAILSTALVIQPGELITFHDDGPLEGRLFPDTYQFYTNADIKDVVQEFIDDYNAKALPLLSADAKNAKQDLILASILEKEVPDPGDQKVVAGLILKRLAAKMPLDIDATICYAKFMKNPTSTTSCYPLSALDLKMDSPYNTYLYRGLPPGPIGNPGVSAIMAAIHPEASSYWYYLSDPKTGKTIFAKTLDEQDQNRVKYLESN
jgi:UPF0755 protein